MPLGSVRPRGLTPGQRITGNALGRCNDEFRAPTLLLRGQGLRVLQRIQHTLFLHATMHCNEFKETESCTGPQLRLNTLQRVQFAAAIPPSARRGAKGCRLRADLTAAKCQACYEVRGHAALCTHVWGGIPRSEVTLRTMLWDLNQLNAQRAAALSTMIWDGALSSGAR